VITGGTGDPDKSLLFYVLYLFDEAFVSFHMGYASALAWALFAIILLLTLANFALARRWVFYEEPGGRW
jgi:multiple sugar transport system permease protein